LGIKTNSEITDDLTLSWSFSSSSYNAVLKYCGTDSGCASPIQTKDMESYSSLSVSGMNMASTHYFSLVVSLQETPAVPDGGSGGGGGGGATGPAIYSLTDAQFTEGVSKYLKVQDKILFNFVKQNHTITLVAFDNQSADIIIESSSMNYNIKLNEKISVDLTGEGNADISVGYVKYAVSSAQIDIIKLQSASGDTFLEEIGKDVGETIERFKIDPVFRMKILTSIFSVLLIIVALIWLLIKLVFKKSNSVSN
jgi:hypothetical protein